MDLRGIKPKGMEFKIAMRCDSPEAVKQAVRQGAGVGILFDGLVRREIQNGDFGEVEIPGLEATRQRYLVCRREELLSPVAKEFLTFVRSSATEAFRTDSRISRRSRLVGSRGRDLSWRGREQFWRPSHIENLLLRLR
jgi:DNA-binding transcriptional LysR family regulator